MSNELHTMPLKCEKLLSSLNCQLMTNAEFGAYMRLLCHAWLNGAWLPDDAIALQKLCNCITQDECKCILDNVINRMFDVVENGRRANKHQLKVYEEVISRQSKISNLRRETAKKRWESKSNALAMHLQCKSNAIQSQSQSQRDIKEKNITKKKPQSPKNKHGSSGNVMLTDDELSKLRTGHGEAMTERLIAKLDAYKGSTGRKYKSDYHAIETWVVAAVVKDSQYLPVENIAPARDLTLDDFEGNQAGYDEYLRRKAEERREHGLA